MAPVKFDDLAKPANEVLNDDYHAAGYQLKAKQKTSLHGSVVTTTVDLFPAKESVQTPAKLTWKLPSVGIAGLTVDKLEVDKAGKFKLEAVGDKALHKVADLKLEAKSDLVDASKATLGFTYSGIAETQVKFETKPLSPADLTLELTRNVQNAVIGVKWAGVANLATPDVGLRVTSGNIALALLAKEQFKSFFAHGFFKASNELKLGVSYQHGGKASGNLSAGLAWTLKPGTLLKAKVQQDGSVTGTVKHDVTKGFTVLAGGKYTPSNGNFTYGLQLSVE